ncbi:MAG: thiamine pyrophosphate-binding protein [Endozoicomonas sp.]
MKKTGAWLVRYALEQIGVTHTFGIPGVHNTEIYDELESSEQIQPVLVTHEGCGAFMADAMSRTSGSIGTMLIVPAAGVTHAASGIGEAFLDGIPMLVISGGIRSDSEFEYQLHDMDQHKLLEPITKKTYKVESQQDVIPTIYEAYELAVSGEPGPVFVEVPVNVQLYKGEVDEITPFHKKEYHQKSAINELLDQAAKLLTEAKRPGIFLGWGAVDAAEHSIALAEHLSAPVSTTLQGLSAFPANHPLHTGMSFGPAAVPAATSAFESCDCLLAVGTRFSEIGTGSFGVKVPENLIHIDINPSVFSVNYPAKVAIEGDSGQVLEKLLEAVFRLQPEKRQDAAVQNQILQQKQAYRDEWMAHDSGDRVNPALFFEGLRQHIGDEDFVVTDDGNHTFLTAELMPIHQSRRFISPTDFNCMGYAVPAVIAAKMANPQQQVVGIIGDGAFLMTCMELITASSLSIGAVFVVFNDGELSQISQAQQIPYNRKTCTQLGNIRIRGITEATGAAYIRMEDNSTVDSTLDEALSIAASNRPVVLDVNVDYSKKTRFTKGIVGTNLKRMPFQNKVRMIGRALKRRVIPA